MTVDVVEGYCGHPPSTKYASSVPDLVLIKNWVAPWLRQEQALQGPCLLRYKAFFFFLSSRRKAVLPCAMQGNLLQLPF